MVSDEQPMVRHVKVSKGYFELSRTERRALLRRLLNGLSPMATQASEHSLKAQPDKPQS